MALALTQDWGTPLVEATLRSIRSPVVTETWFVESVQDVAAFEITQDKGVSTPFFTRVTV